MWVFDHLVARTPILRCMPTYAFACRACGNTFDQRHSMAEVPDQAECPECSQPAPRTISNPRLGIGNTTAMKLQDATRATADAPQVVTQLPGRARKPTPVSRNPLHQKLPRP